MAFELGCDQLLWIVVWWWKIEKMVRKMLGGLKFESWLIRVLLDFFEVIEKII
jgi:hypothetical protein